GIRRGKSGNAGANAGNRRGGRAQGRAGERVVSRASHGNSDVKGAGRGAGEKTRGKPARTVARFSEYAAAGPRADGRRNCARRIVSVFGAVQRDHRSINQCGWGSGVLLRSSGAYRL